MRKTGGYIISLKPSLNCLVAGRTDKQYYSDNKETVLRQHQEYYVNNKDKVSQRHKEYREQHKEQISEIPKTYYENYRRRLYYKRMIVNAVA